MSGLISTRYRNGKDTPHRDRGHCPWCCDQGLVMVSTEQFSSNFKGRAVVADREMWGPCPNCEVGLALENEHWPRGFWQGRTVDIVRGCHCNDDPAPRDEVRAAFKKAWAKMNENLTEPDPKAGRIRYNPGQRLRPGGGGGAQRPALPPAKIGGGRETEAVGTRKPAVEAPPGPGAALGAHHRCPGYDGKDMPWPQDTCEACGPTTEEVTL